jgi:hypothetical protein
MRIPDQRDRSFRRNARSRPAECNPTRWNSFTFPGVTASNFGQVSLCSIWEASPLADWGVGRWPGNESARRWPPVCYKARPDPACVTPRACCGQPISWRAGRRRHGAVGFAFEQVADRAARAATGTSRGRTGGISGPACPRVPRRYRGCPCFPSRGCAPSEIRGHSGRRSRSCPRRPGSCV